MLGPYQPPPVGGPRGDLPYTEKLLEGQRWPDTATRELKSGDVWLDVTMGRSPPRAHRAGIADFGGGLSRGVS